MWASMGPSSTSRSFWSASAAVQRAGFAAATTGNIVPARHIKTNETYQLEFYGPAIKCVTADKSVRDAARKTVRAYSGSGGQFSFWAWAGNDHHGLLSSNSTLDLDTTWTTLDLNVDVSRFSVYSLLGWATETQHWGNVTECLLHNATYSVEFTNVGGQPTATVQQRTLHERVGALRNASATNGVITTFMGQVYSYQSVMDVLGRLLAGYAYAQNAGTQVTYSSFQRTYVDVSAVPSVFFIAPDPSNLCPRSLSTRSFCLRNMLRETPIFGETTDSGYRSGARWSRLSATSRCCSLTSP